MKKLLLLGIVFTVSVYAQDSFGELNEVFIEWAQGNLGKLLAIIGFTITFVGYIVMNMVNGEKSYNMLMIGSSISLIAGGMVGIANTFFNLGGATFSLIG